MTDEKAATLVRLVSLMANPAADEANLTAGERRRVDEALRRLYAREGIHHDDPDSEPRTSERDRP